MSVSTRQVRIHGHAIRFLHHQAPVRHGRRRKNTVDRDPIVLIHGIAGDGASWLPVFRELIRRNFDRDIIALDLLGHGGSAKPSVDYSLGMFATTVRDLLMLLGYRRATVVGHSLGGAVAMQFAYQFPQQCGRMVLVSSGGLGREVFPLIRAANLPGAEMAMSLLLKPAILALGPMLGKLTNWSPEDRALARCFTSLTDQERRAAYVRIARHTTDMSGQRDGAANRLHLAELVPSLIVWGEKDWIIPVKHGIRAAKLMPGSRLEIISGTEHFPHIGAPERFAGALMTFVRTSIPADVGSEELATHLRGRPLAG